MVNGPYVVKHTRPLTLLMHRGLQEVPVLSDVAVATLDEARREVLGPDAVHVPALVAVVVESITEQGGKVSLPDATEIEVERVTYAWLADKAGFDVNAYKGDTFQACLAILNVYNRLNAEQANAEPASDKSPRGSNEGHVR